MKYEIGDKLKFKSNNKVYEGEVCEIGLGLTFVQTSLFKTLVEPIDIIEEIKEPSILDVFQSCPDGLEIPDRHDIINNPNHYTSGGIEPIHYIISNKLDFLEGNIIKYVTRYKLKNGLEDLKKARFYLDKLISIQE